MSDFVFYTLIFSVAQQLEEGGDGRSLAKKAGNTPADLSLSFPIQGSRFCTRLIQPSAAQYWPGTSIRRIKSNFLRPPTTYTTCWPLLTPDLVPAPDSSSPVGERLVRFGKANRGVPAFVVILNQPRPVLLWLARDS